MTYGERVANLSLEASAELRANGITMRYAHLYRELVDATNTWIAWLSCAQTDEARPN